MLPLLAVVLALAACRESRSSKPEPLTERTFHRRERGGDEDFTVHVRATRKVPPAMLDVLERTLEIHRAGEQPAQELAFWQDPAMPVDPKRAEVSVQLLPMDPLLDPKGFLWTWPDYFQISRPGVLEFLPHGGGEQMAPRSDAPKEGDTGVIRQALHGGPDHVRGRLLCGGAPAPFLRVATGGIDGFAGPDGRFEISGEFPGVPKSVSIAFDAQIPLGSAPAPAVRLEIFDDFHVTRSERVDLTPTVTGTTADFGDITIPGTDCVLWQRGIRALTHYFATVGAPPPAGELRIKRWSAVYISAGAAPHTFYDYIVAPTDLATFGAAPFFHEFGHSVRHVADGPRSHWDWDNFRFIYARIHDGSQVTNKGFTFNEGWGTYWGAVVTGGGVPVHPAAPTDPAFMDFNEDRVAERLMALSRPVGHRFMVNVLLNNPGVIHTLEQFEQRYCAAVGAARNPFCRDGLPIRTVPSCPPGFSDDGLTCRLINIIGKPTFDRGVGTPPTSCGPGREYDWGLCYPLCPPGFSGAGPFCYQECPPDYYDDGLTCRLDPWIFGADTSACPWYDICGLTFAQGCSVCPPELDNDGCTCVRHAHIFGKARHDRGVGAVPDGCPAGLQYDTGLCYNPCPAGFSGAGPACWGSCPAGFADHGATCYRDPNVFPDDPVVPP
jgi:hypothetical protein